MKINKLISVLLAAAFVFSVSCIPVSSGIVMSAYAYSAETTYSANEVSGTTATTTIRPSQTTVRGNTSDAAELCLNDCVYLSTAAIKSASAEPITTTTVVKTEAATTYTTTAEAEWLPEDTTATTVTVISTEEPSDETVLTTTVTNPPYIDTTATSLSTTVNHTTTTVTTTTTPHFPSHTLTTTTTTTPPPSVNLIMQCSISCSDEPGILLISGKTQGVQRLDEIGFRNLEILRSYDGLNWTVEKNIGAVSDKNALIFVLDKYKVKVNGGAYYSISCEHYAKDEGLEQTVYNTSSYVWIEKAEPEITTQKKDNITSNENTATTGKSEKNNAEKIGTQVNVTVYESSPETGESGIGVTVAVMITAISAALIMRKKNEE